MLITIILVFSFVSCQQPVAETSNPQDAFYDSYTIVNCQAADLADDTTIGKAIAGPASGSMTISGTSTYNNGAYTLSNIVITFNNFDYGGKYIIKSGSLTLNQSGTIAGQVISVTTNTCTGTLSITGKHTGIPGINSSSRGSVDLSNKTITATGSAALTFNGITINHTFNRTIAY